MGAQASKEDKEKCEPEFNAYLKCVESHSQGLKALDCEEIRELYKQCMKKETS